MFVKVAASPSATRFQHRFQQNAVEGPKTATRPSSGSFGGTASTIIAHPKKRSVVSSSSQIKFTALARMAENQRAMTVSGNTLSQSAEDHKTGTAQTDSLIPPPTTIRKSESLQSLRRVGRRVRNNHCAVAFIFLFFGLLFNALSYFISVQSAQLQAELVESAVANHEAKFNLKKMLVSGPSKYIIGLFSFLGRVTSAVGTFFLAQAVVTWFQKRKSKTLRSAAGHADDAIGEVHGGCSEIVGDCLTNCIPAFG
uniref:Uncharacterized protein n=1 Tax=Panagrolaimus sp. JU765 TaxID=591449 RepID=A0AC34RIQ1_9BILA